MKSPSTPGTAAISSTRSTGAVAAGAAVYGDGWVSENEP